MGKRIVGYVISHSGKPGGPWECDDDGPWGISTAVSRERIVWGAIDLATKALPKIAASHPAARILRLVRRERHRAEEAAVVEAAMAFDEADAKAATWADVDAAEEKYHAACAALRAKRGE